MADDEELKPHHATARPPPGEEDVYSASTVASEASDEMLAIIRGESQRAIPAAPGLPKNLKVDPKSDPKIAVRSGAKPAPSSELPDMRVTAPPPPLPRPQIAKPPPAAGAPPPPPSSGGGSKPAYTATPLEVPVTNLTATTDPPKTVEIAPDPAPASTPETPPAAASTTKTDPPAAPREPAPAPAAFASAIEGEPNFKKGTMHPAVGIVLFFVAVLVVLAAIVR
jgi:hypothetical protein